MSLNSSLHTLSLRIQYALFSIRKALRKKPSDAEPASDLLFDKGRFFITDDKGDKVKHDVLLTFDYGEDIHYVIHTDDSKDEAGVVQVYFSRYIVRNNAIELHPINSEDELGMIQSLWEDVQLKTMNGESIEEYYYQDDETLEPLHEVIIKKVVAFSEKLQSPIYLVIPYLIGVLLLHFQYDKPMPIWVEVLLAVLELFVIHWSYKFNYGIVTSIKWYTALVPWLIFLFSILNPVRIRLIPNSVPLMTDRVLLVRSSLIALYLVLLALSHRNANRSRDDTE